MSLLEEITNSIIHEQIAILSGKGGVGKSLITVNLALELSRLGLKVAIFDADIDAPNLSEVANLPKNIKMNVQNERIIPYDWGGIKLVSLSFSYPEGAPVLWDDSQKQEVIEQILRLTDWGEVDYMLVDCPAGSGGELYAVLSGFTTGAIIVTTPQAAAISDAKRTIQALNEYKTPLIGVINNMTFREVKCPGCNRSFRVDFLKEKTWSDDLLLGELPDDPFIRLTNRINDFSVITAKILKRLPHLKEVKHYTGKRNYLQRRAASIIIKKITT